MVGAGTQSQSLSRAGFHSCDAGSPRTGTSSLSPPKGHGKGSVARQVWVETFHLPFTSSVLGKLLVASLL